MENKVFKKLIPHSETLNYTKLLGRKLYSAKFE